MIHPNKASLLGRRFMAGVTLLAMAGSLSAAEGRDAPNPTERVIAEATWALTGRTATVNCLSSEAMFYTTGRNLQGGTDGRQLFLESSVCDDITEIIDNPPETEADIYIINTKNFEEDTENLHLGSKVDSLHTLTHEIAHISGVREEADAECAAIQGIGAVAIELGVPAHLAGFVSDIDRQLVLEGPVIKPREYALPPDCMVS